MYIKQLIGSIANISSTPPAPEFYLSHSDLIAIVKGKDGLYFSNKKRDKLSEMEPLIGGYPSSKSSFFC
jgi:hypothetical protein